MLKIFKPDLLKKSVFEITPSDLTELNVKGIILDIDDTIVPRATVLATKELISWLDVMRDAGFLAVIVSNNFKRRVSKISEQLNIDYFSFGLKPFPVGIDKAIKYFKLKPSEVCVVGDQIFTDLLGAKFCNTKVVLVEPMSEAKTFMLKIKRSIERAIKKSY